MVYDPEVDILRAPPGSIIAVQAGDDDYAVAGGNVCAVAQRRGIVAFIIGGEMHDIAEARANGFPLFARGISPIPDGKNILEAINAPVCCCGVDVLPGDRVVADEEGIVVVPAAQADTILGRAQAKAAKDGAETLDTWEAAHRARIVTILKERGWGLGKREVKQVNSDA